MTNIRPPKGHKGNLTSIHCDCARPFNHLTSQFFIKCSEKIFLRGLNQHRVKTQIGKTMSSRAHKLATDALAVR